MARSIFSIFKGSNRKSGAVGVMLHAEAVALARLAHLRGHKPRVDAFASRALGDATEQAEALRDLVREQNAQGAPCVLTLEPGAYTVVQVERPAVPAEEMRSAVRWRIKDLLDYPADEAVVDVFDVPGLEERGRAPSVYVVAAHQHELKRRIEMIAEADLQLAKINITELALRNLALLAAEGEESISLVHMFRHRGMIAIVRAAALYVARNLEHGYAEVESLVAAAGSAESLNAPDNQELYERIALEFQRTMDYYDSYFAQPPVRKMLLLARTQRLSDLADYARDNLGLDVTPCDLHALLEIAGEGDAETLADCALAIAGALDEDLLGQ
jgi:MSHA biogenesis protein MshI